MYSTFSHIQKFYQTTVSSQAPATLLLYPLQKPKTFLRISLFSWSAGVWHLRCTIFPKLLSTCQSTKPTIKHVAAEAISFLFFKSYRMDPATPSQQKHGSAYANGVLFCFLRKMHWVRQNGLRYPPFRYHHVFYPHCRHTPFSQTAAYSNIHPIKNTSLLMRFLSIPLSICVLQNLFLFCHSCLIPTISYAIAPQDRL